MEFATGQKVWRRRDHRPASVLAVFETSVAVHINKSDGSEGRLAIACNASDFMDETELLAEDKPR